MSGLLESAQEKGLLPLITAFHALEFRRRERQAFKAGDVETETLLRELFEPERITPRGMRRSPVEVEFHRGGWVVGESATIPVAACRLSLREVDLQVPAGAPLRVGQDVVVALDGIRGAKQFGFVGQVARIDPSRGHVILHFEAPLDPELLSGGGWGLGTEEQGNPAAPSPTRVLVAVREPLTREALLHHLTKLGFTCHALVDEQHVIRWLGTSLMALGGCDLTHVTLPEVIVTDVKVPGQCGQDLMAGLDLLGWSTSIVFLKGLGDTRLETTAAELGSACTREWHDLPSLVEVIREAGASQQGHLIVCAGAHSGRSRRVSSALPAA